MSDQGSKSYCSSNLVGRTRIRTCGDTQAANDESVHDHMFDFVSVITYKLIRFLFVLIVKIYT